MRVKTKVVLAHCFFSISLIRSSFHRLDSFSSIVSRFGCGVSDCHLWRLVGVDMQGLLVLTALLYLPPSIFLHRPQRPSKYRQTLFDQILPNLSSLSAQPLNLFISSRGSNLTPGRSAKRLSYECLNIEDIQSSIVISKYSLSNFTNSTFHLGLVSFFSFSTTT